MTAQTILSVVPPDVTPALSPAREGLAKALRWRDEARANLEEVIRQHRRVESLIPAGEPIGARIAELELEHSTIIEAWMLKEGEPHPALPHIAEIDRLKVKLREAEIVASSAKSALANINAQLTACQGDINDAVDRIWSAADGVLVEIAETLAAELEQTERRAALVRGQLTGLARHFEIAGQRGRSGGAAAAVAKMIPRGPFELAPQSINLAVDAWRDLAGRLVSDETAAMKETGI